jgi:hypothetical protein
MNPPDKIWANLLDTIRNHPVSVTDQAETRAMSKRLLQWCAALEILHTTHPKLYFGESGVTFSSGEAKKLRDALIAGTALRHAVLRIRFINRGLRRGLKEEKWQCALLPELVFLPRDPPLFTPQTFRYREQCRVLSEAFMLKLTQPVVNMKPNQAIGQLLVSAILFGGLLSRRWLAPWVKALGAGIRINEGTTWIDMMLPVRVESNRAVGLTSTNSVTEVHRRWFPDQVTEALLFRVKNNYPQILEEAGRIIVPEEVSAVWSPSSMKAMSFFTRIPSPGFHHHSLRHGALKGSSRYHM